MGNGPVFGDGGGLNGDGRPDLIVANRQWGPHGLGAVQHHRPGRPTPSFATQQTFATGSYPGR